jgi:adenosylhomocysteine nucleosidase
MIKTAIVVALEREIRPLVKRWPRSGIPSVRPTLSIFQNGDVIAVAGGIGSRQAEWVARQVVEQYQPKTLISAGLAGALIRSLKAGSVVTPNVVVDAATGAEYRCNMSAEVGGGGVLVSAREIAGQDSKLGLVDRFHGLLVDMEAAGVARVAEEFNIGFRCVKAISDELDFVMPPLNRFVDSQGNFSTRAFFGWAAVRPKHWLSVVRLSRNSRRAIHALCDWLGKNMASDVAPAAVVTLDGAKQSNPMMPRGVLRTPNTKR